MKRKLVCWLLIATLSFSLVACGNSEDSHAEESTQADEATNETAEETGTIEVDENLLTIEITLPAEYAQDITQEELDSTSKESGFKSATLNDDGSVTYVMTKGKHKELMKEMQKEYSDAINAMIGSEEYPNITDIEFNKDFTSFTVTTKNTELDFAESFSVIAFYMYGGLYNCFNNTPVDNVHVDFVNADSGEIISSADSKDFAETAE